MSGASPQYAGLFAFGVAASAIAFSPEAIAVRLRERVSWKSVSWAALILLIGAFFVRGDYLTAAQWAGDTLVGLVVSVVILHYTLEAQNGAQSSPVLRVLGSPFALWLGLISYSIYLIHSPLLGLFNLLTLPFPLSDDARLALMAFVAVPLTVGVS